ncbi:MAG: glycerophosphodiester phosphodiesterase [Chthoniobacterales bacterium]
MSLLEKLLSHRLRGFGQFEHTASALKAACASAAPFLEADARASRDGEIFLWHDVRTGKLADPDLVFADTDTQELAGVRYRNGEPILSLRDALKIFSSHSSPAQKLCLDLKDFGFEETCLRMVREADLEERVCFISWIPQTVIRLKELETTAPLVLSCCNLIALGPLGKVLDSLLANCRFRLGWIVLLGRNKSASSLGPLAHGFQHGFFCRRLPGPLLQALASSRGGICVNRWLTGEALTEYCRDSGLSLWVFSTETAPQYLAYASRLGIDVVFCDDAPIVLDALSKM